MRNNEGEWFKALLATGGCSSLLTLFLLLLPHSFWVCLVSLNPSILVDVSCNEGKRSSLVSCFLVWYALFCSLLFLFHLLLSFLLFSSVFFSIFEDVNTFNLNGETELQNFKMVFYRAQSHWATRSSLKPELVDPLRSFRLSRSWPAFPNLTSTWTWGDQNKQNVHNQNHGQI